MYFNFILLPLLIKFITRFQEDLTPNDTLQILDELKAGKKPPPGPRYVHYVNNM